MIITKELLRRYHQGLCSEEERRAVERWLNATDDPSSDLNLISEKEFDHRKGLIWSKMSQVAPDLEVPSRINYGKNRSNELGQGKTATFLFKQFVRLSAAACIIFAVFFAGRLSVNTGYANPVVDKTPKDHLFIYGGNGAKGNLPGQAFKVLFNGRLRLYNESQMTKRIQVGDQEFVLESYQIYYLSGSIEKPTLLSSKYFPNDHFENITLEGDFSILRLDD